MFARLFTCHHETPTLAAELAEARRELWASERRRARAEGQLDHYIGQAIRARVERDAAEQDRDETQRILVRALAERDDAVKYGLYLDGEIDGFLRRERALTATADRLRDELRELRAAVTIGAAQKKGKR